FFFQAEDGIRDRTVTGVQTCALPISHPPPRASRVSRHPPQVSGLTLAHPCSPTLTRPRPPPSARLIDSGCAGPFLAPGQRGRNEIGRASCRERVKVWVVGGD